LAREIEVYTTAEIAQLIERLGKDIRGVKTAYPGSAVAEIRDREQPATFGSKQEREAHIQELADRFQSDDEIPFG
jgi:hypothetical protein